MAKKLYIKTYGCQMNVYDTARMHDVMAPLGYTPTDTPEDADCVILNTCHIREKADEKVYSDLGRIREHKKKNSENGKGMIIAVGGCVGQAEGAEIVRRAPYVDIVMGPQSYHKLPQMMLEAARKNKHVIDLDFPAISKFDSLPEARSQGAVAFLSVQEGCDKFCTFCVVPYTRGAEFSRTVEEIEREAHQLVNAGAIHLYLLGQNVNAYHGLDAYGTNYGLAELLRRLAAIEGVQRLSYTTSHPRDMDDALIAVHAEEPKLMPYLHLPVQSGSDAVLAKMNRKHTAAFYLDIIERLRRVKPDIALSSDFIVGFPGETEEDFESTLRLVETVGYAQAYSFKYSPRPGTPAATYENHVPDYIQDQRLQRLQALITRQQTLFNTASVGKVVDVLFEKPGKHKDQWIGKSPYQQSVHVIHQENLQGKLLPVRLVSATASSLRGEIVNAEKIRYTA